MLIFCIIDLTCYWKVALWLEHTSLQQISYCEMALRLQLKKKKPTKNQRTPSS